MNDDRVNYLNYAKLSFYFYYNLISDKKKYLLPIDFHYDN